MPTEAEDPLDLICYLHPTWAPHIRPAEVARDWMSASPEAFAHRCLPLNIANTHGWEILAPCGFEARWNGGMTPADVEILTAPGAEDSQAPVSIFGQGMLTFHIAGLFRTPPAWNLWIGGSPNRFKDGIAPLTGIVETDWSPYTFTMNWRFTRPRNWVRFVAGEPIGFFFPLPRAYLETVAPRFETLTPELAEKFETWSRSREAFQARMIQDPPSAPADKWQKNYYRGVEPDGSPGVADHQAKLRLKPFKPLP
jgi:hypothetical protein